MFPTTQVKPASLVAALSQSKVAETSDGGSKAFLKLDANSGTFLFGRSGDDVTGEEIVVNTGSIQHGYTLWVDGKAEKRSVPFNQDLPAPMDGRTDSEGDFCSPTESRYFEARFEDDSETVVVYDANSFGARKGVDALLSAIRLRATSGEEEFLYPKVLLDSESYKNKKAKGKTIHNPIFKVVAWLNLEGEEQVVNAQIADSNDGDDVDTSDSTSAAEAAPKRRRRKATA